MIFGQYLDNYLKDLDETWSEVRQNGYKSDAKDSMVKSKPILKIFRPIDSKMDQNLWMIQKIFDQNFFGLNASEYFNSKSYHVKSEI